MLGKKIVRNTVVNAGGKLLSFALQLILITYLIHHLGTEAYGVVVLALALVANTNILEAGFGLSVTKYVAEYRAKGDRDSLLRVVNTNLVIATVLALIMSAVLLVINEFFLGKLFTIPAALLSGTKQLIRFLIVLSIAEFWSVSLIRVAEGFQQYALARSMELIKWLLRVIFVFISVAMGYGLPGIGIALLAAGVLNLAIVYFQVIVRSPELRVSPALSSWTFFRQLFGFSIWILIAKVFAFLSYKIDVIIIGIFLSPVYLTFYNVAFKIFEILRYGLSLVSSTLVPVTSELSALTDRQKMALLFEKATKYSVVLIGPMFVLFYFYMDEIVRIWVGEGFDTAVSLGRLFIIALVSMSFITSGTEMMVGINRVRELVKFNAVATAVNLILSIYLVREIGVSGVVIGTVAGSVIIMFTYLPFMMKSLDVMPVSFFNNVLFKPLSALFIMVCSMYFIPGSIGSAAGLILYAAACSRWLIDKDDIRKILKT